VAVFPPTPAVSVVTMDDPPDRRRAGVGAGVAPPGRTRRRFPATTTSTSYRGGLLGYFLAIGIAVFSLMLASFLVPPTMTGGGNQRSLIVLVGQQWDEKVPPRAGGDGPLTTSGSSIQRGQRDDGEKLDNDAGNVGDNNNNKEVVVVGGAAAAVHDDDDIVRAAAVPEIIWLMSFPNSVRFKVRT